MELEREKRELEAMIEEGEERVQAIENAKKGVLLSFCYGIRGVDSVV